jgi:hypothetical protein
MVKGYPPPLPFVMVSLTATGIVTIGWRTALAAFSPQVPNPPLILIRIEPSTPVAQQMCRQCHEPAGGVRRNLFKCF